MDDVAVTANDRVVLVTGAGRGIGAAIATRFADEGCSVVGAELDPPADGDPRIRFEQADVSAADDVAALFDRIAADYGRLDVLVNNAGIWFRRAFQEISVQEWDQVMGVNLRSVFLCTRGGLTPMRAAGGGSIINIGSQAGLTVTRGQGAHYHASKAAISHLTKVLAYELGPVGIRVNCVAPSALIPDPSVVPSHLLAQIPLGRTSVPADVSGAVTFLASPEASYITGQTLAVNGGAVAFL